jgi:hypothetical protein
MNMFVVGGYDVEASWAAGGAIGEDEWRLKHRERERERLHGLTSVIYATQLGQSRRRKPRTYGA